MARAVDAGAPGADAHARRPALDGLRALAVTSVAVYHFGGGGTSVLRGGFLGVDVFFVLSGYLITGLLLAEHARSGRVDLPGFWVRRVRRLVPALVLVLLAVCAWVWWIQPPETWLRRRADLFWTLGYAANWHFVQVGEDYFAGYAGASPLRHTWSLAIEEQFYLVWPLVVAAVLVLAGRRLLRVAGAGVTGRRAVAALCAAGIAASAVTMAVQFAPGDPTRAYYGTDGRVQELFVGALLALAVRRLRVPGWLPWAGLGVLAVAMALMTDAGAPYYRGGALAVSLATALVVTGVEHRPRAALARMFSWAPVVAVGRISYGLYLWHWPVAVAFPVRVGDHGWHEVRIQALRVVVTVAVSALSYRYVEQPVLQGRVPWVRRSRLRLALVTAVAFALVGASSAAATRLPGDLGRQLVDGSERPCPGETREHLETCVKIDSGPGAPVVAVFGDSTARALAPGLDAWAPGAGVTWVQSAWQRCTATGLVVVPNGTTGPDVPAQTCRDQARVLQTAVLQRYHPATVLVGEFWSHHQRLLVGGRMLGPGTPEHLAALRTELLEVVDEVSAAGGRTVLLELPPPGRTLGGVVAPGRPAGRMRPVGPGAAQVVGFNGMLREVARQRPDAAVTVSVDDLVCPGGTCAPLQGGLLVRTDGVHYSARFSRLLVPQLMTRVDRALDGLPAADVG